MGRKFAILGDIHSNLEALNAVLDDCRSQGVTDFLCTGDVVGYNACPKECMDIVRSLGCPVVKGNHDDYVSNLEQDLRDFPPHAAAVVEWTRCQLSEEEIQWLYDLPFEAVKMGISLVHATNDKPASFGYVFDNSQAEANFIKQRIPLCFHGHTHCPMIYEKSMSGVFRIDPQPMKLPVGKKYFINVGSVGQPRDGDPRAAYALYDAASREVSFRRIEYDIAAAQERIRMAGLPERLAERLQYGQ